MYSCFARLKATFFPCGVPDETGKWQYDKQSWVEYSEDRPHP